LLAVHSCLHVFALDGQSEWKCVIRLDREVSPSSASKAVWW